MSICTTARGKSFHNFICVPSMSNAKFLFISLLFYVRNLYTGSVVDLDAPVISFT